MIKNTDTQRPARVIAIASGKSGVGKSNITTNLAIALATRGLKVCILDADTRPTRTRDLLGTMPAATLEQLLSGEKQLDDLITDGPSGVTIFPAAAGLADYVSLDDIQRKRFVQALQDLERRFDCLLIDTASGVRNTVMHFLRSSHYVVMVLTPEPSSLSNSFAMLQVLKKRGQRNPIHVLVNMVQDYSESVETFKRFERNVRKFLQIPAYYLGYIKVDETVTSSVTLKRPVILLKHSAPASQCFYKLAENLTTQFKDEMERVPFSMFWKNLAMKSGLTAHGRHPTGTYDRPVPPPAPTPVTAKAAITKNETVTATSLDRKTLSDQSLKLLKDIKLNAQEAQDFLAPLIEASVRRFRDYPFNTREVLMEHLRLRNYPSIELRQLISLLEDAYEKQHKLPIHSLESNALRLFAQVRGDEKKVEELSQYLRTGFKAQFGKELFDPVREILSKAQDPEFLETDFARLMEELHHTYEHRFGRPWASDDKIEYLLEKVVMIIDEISEQERSLNESLFSLFERLKLMSDSKTGLVSPPNTEHREDGVQE